MTFLEKLLQTSRRNRSLLCIGLDPNPDLMPEINVSSFNKEIIDATSDIVCAYKPNLAFYEALGLDGLRALEKTLEHMPGGIPLIGDAKRGDISSSSAAYAKAVFDIYGFDAITVSPYLGHDSITPFSDYRDKGVFLLCKTSNPGASDFQEAPCLRNGEQIPLYELVAVKALEWNTYGNLGLVVGATYPRQLKRIRELCPELPLLIPGIGTQGGDLEATVLNGTDACGERAIINCSRQIIYASKGNDFAEAARHEAEEIRNRINTTLKKRP